MTDPVGVADLIAQLQQAPIYLALAVGSMVAVVGAMTLSRIWGRA